MTRRESSVISFLVPCCKVWLKPIARVPYSNVANTGERKTWTQSEFCTRQNSVRGQEPPKMHIQSTSPEDGQTSCKVWLTSVEQCRCRKVKTQKPVKFAGVPQTRQPISVVSGPKFTILWGPAEEILLFNKFFPIVDMCLSCEDIAQQTFCNGAQMANFCQFFCILYFQRAACSTFQTCILNSH